MNLVTFNPEQPLDRFFDTDQFFRFPIIHGEQPTMLPKVNVIEKDEEFYMEAEIPGMTQKDVLIEFNDGVLTLKGNREQSSHSDKNDYRIHEFNKQNFARSFKLNDQIDSENVVARMDQGILKVTLPKKEKAKPKKIEIKVEP
jgi:HSP20 family protein